MKVGQMDSEKLSEEEKRMGQDGEISLFLKKWAAGEIPDDYCYRRLPSSLSSACRLFT